MPPPVKQIDRRQQVATALGVEKRALRRGKPRMLTDIQRAKQLGVSVSQLKTPFQLSPAAPRAKSAYLDLYSSFMVLSETPPATGSAWFNSAAQWAVPPCAAISFPRLKQGQTYLVEFHVKLWDPSQTYQFRTFSYPAATFEDISLAGGQTKPILVLIQPADTSELGADITQWNDAADNAGWTLYSVRVSATQ
jgi:hypothetical protein